MKKLSLLLGSLLLSGVGFAQNTPFFTSYPSLSPDAKEIYFSFDGDIWKVPAEGGNALRVVSLEGDETRPIVSPDGKKLAFTSTIYGNEDVFVLSLETGDIKQITFHSGSDKVESWSWDSKTIYFTSNRYNGFGSYAVSADGGTARPLFDKYFTTSDALVETPDGAYIFTNSMESNRQQARKRYKGANNPDLLYYNPATKDYKQLTDYIGKDFHPSVDSKGNIYYISDENTGEYNLYTLNGEKPQALTTFDSSIKTPHVSANGQKVVFEKDYQLYLYDVSTKQTSKVDFTAASHYVLDKKEKFTTDRISYLDVSPDGKKFAFVSRGVLFVSNAKGEFVNEILNDGERVLEVKWLKNNEDLIFSKTYNGFPNWYKISAKGGEAQQITKDLATNREIHLNEDRSLAVYLSGSRELKLLDLNTLKARTIVDDEFWAFQNSAPSFSPDSKYVLFTAMRDFEQDIFVHHIASNKTYNITETRVSETNPTWSADGKHIYFASNRTEPSYPFGMQNPSIYKLALDWYAGEFNKPAFESLFEKEDKSKKEDKTPVVKINFEDLKDRITQVTKSFGSQNNPKAFGNEERNLVFYSSNEDGGSYGLYKVVYEAHKKADVKKVSDMTARQIIQTSKNTYVLNTARGVYDYNESTNKLTKVNISKSFEKDLEGEFYQMFEETWAGLGENFYEENYHGMDWTKLREHYQKFLPHIQNRDNLRVVLNDMLGELNSSHLGFNSSGKEERTKLSYTTAETGVLFQQNNPYVVERIVAKSPAVAEHIDIRKGDKLIAVNGVKVDESKDRDFYFTATQLAPELHLEFERNGAKFEVLTKTINSGRLGTLLYDEWIANNRQNVKDWSNDRIAYTYMKNMTGPQLESFLLDMVREENNREALILDLRFNTGGNVHDKVLNFLSRRPYLLWKYRDGKKTTQGNFGPSAGPIVLLINQASLSDAEMTAAGFKALGLGTIIGTETYRWIIFTSSKGLVDNSSFRVPAWGCYTMDGDNLELTGVSPDIHVENTFEDMLNDNDPQLERAIQEILKQLD